MFKELWRKKLMVVFLAALLILFPSASVRPAEALSKTILLSVGVERTEDGYTVFGAAIANMYAPSGPDGTQESKVISADGETIPEAFKKVTADQGRAVSMAYCNMIVLGNSLSGENVADVLRYFVEKFEITNNALLVWTDAKVEKILEASAKNKTDAAGGMLETIAAHNQKNVFKKPLTLSKFYKDYLNGHEGFMNALSLEDDEIVNQTQMAVFRNGLYVGNAKVI